jgi:hypothetical protein
MGAWKVVADSDRYRSLLPSDEECAAALFQKFDGRRLGRSWKPLRVKLHKVGKAGDFPALASHIPVFNEKALLVLGPLLQGSVEALPLDCDEGSFFAINILAVIDCLDLANSEVTRFSTGEILSIDRYALFEEYIPDTALFKLPQERLRHPFATNAFRKAVRKHSFKGLEFEEVSKGAQ